MTRKKQQAAFGEAVKQLREARGWSQQELASRLGLPHGSTVGNWEQGKGAREENVLALEQIFGLGPGELGWILGQALPPTVHSPENAIEADNAIPPAHKRTLLAHLAEIRRLSAEADDPS